MVKLLELRLCERDAAIHRFLEASESPIDKAENNLNASKKQHQKPKTSNRHSADSDGVATGSQQAISETHGEKIRIRGACVHNLKSIDLDIPRDALTVISGVSGSGKSSLAFDTLYAEGQRQYIDSLSAYARQFLDQMPRPDVVSIDGLAPTLAIDQKPGSNHARSTVATVTEIYDYLRVLYARIGVPHCANCGSTIAKQSSEKIVERFTALPDATRVVLLAPMIRGRRGSHREVFEEIQKAGLIRVRVDGEIHLLEEVPELAPRKLHTIEAVVDRLVIRGGIESRLIESVHLALRLGKGVMAALLDSGAGSPADGNQAAGSAAEEHLFSTLMACVHCGQSFDEIEPRTFSFNSPYGACPSCDGLGRDSETGAECTACGGGRLGPTALSVTVDGLSIDKLVAHSLDDARGWFSGLEERLGHTDRAVAEPISREVLRRLDYLIEVGVPYLTLARSADTLSGGELQRVRLATSLGSGLVGVCYVLDEPSIGLHPSDHDRLIRTIRSLQESGNTVVVVEHDEATIREADFVVDIGPGAGEHGGRLISQGSPQEVENDPESLTGLFLRGEETVAKLRDNSAAASAPRIILGGASQHNLKNVKAEFPLGCMIGVSGVSGSGKSTLINDTLYPALAESLGLKAKTPGVYQNLLGADLIDKLVPIDQSPIGRSPRSCPATYSGVLDEIRKVFAATREAKAMGFTAARFSFNSKSGQCELCKGHGAEKIEMNFLSDLFVTCTRCGGKRFNRQTLLVRFKGLSMADVLNLSIDDAADVFNNIPKVHRLLLALQKVGLGYIKLGQSSTTLSGGEAQRIKLGTELAKRATGKTLYLLDEPTTGLHFADVRRLIQVLHGLVDAGNTVIVIEHQFDVLASCDWMIDLGPVGGVGGGNILAMGPPSVIAENENSPTSRYLRPILGRLSSIT